MGHRLWVALSEADLTSMLVGLTDLYHTLPWCCLMTHWWSSWQDLKVTHWLNSVWDFMVLGWYTSDLYEILWKLQWYTTDLYEMFWELTEVGYGGQMLAILWIVLQASFEAVQCSNAKEVHFAVVWFLEGLQDVAQGNAQVHVPTTPGQWASQSTLHKCHKVMA